jgi:hypothetical protein
LLVAVGVAVGILAAGVRVQASYEQRIDTLDPNVEQRVEQLGDGQDQHVEVVEPTQQQDIGPQVPPSPAAKAASKAGKFILGVTAAALAVGVMVAELLFI